MGENGPLAAALAKAQASFATVKKDKTVKAGSYSYKYAPLDSIIEATRQPLADNGLVVVQLIDDDDLVTMLIHESGAQLAGRASLPTSAGIQELGSAITYLRRYALQALLGIAAEDDDDGNRAAEDRATPRKATRQPDDDDMAANAGTTHRDGLIGKAITQGLQDGELREAPDGWSLPFRIKEGRLSQIVVAHGDIAKAMDSLRDDWLDKRVTVWGTFSNESYNKGDETIRYKVLHLERIATPDWILPAPVTDSELPAEAPGQVAAFELDPEERLLVGGGMPE